MGYMNQSPDKKNSGQTNGKKLSDTLMQEKEMDRAVILSF